MNLMGRSDEYRQGFEDATDRAAPIIEARERDMYEAMRECDEARQQLQGAVKALERIRDHGQTHDEPCWAITNGDCADVMQEIARATLSRLGGQ